MPSTAICDQGSFYPFRWLVEGKLSPGDLPGAERFIRALVLHDEVRMILRPLPDMPDDREWEPEEIAAGGRNVIIAFGPNIDQYEAEGLLEPFPHAAAPDVELSNELINVAREESGAHEGPYYEAHVDFLQALVSTVQRGGSIICESEAAEHAIQVTSEIPDAVLNGVEEGWVEMVRSASEGNIGLVVPPFVSILLSRCARRDAILPVLRDMKAEYADGRKRIWNLMNELRNVTSIARAREIRHELEEAARAMNPQNEWPEFFPVRALWKLVMAVVGGAVVGQIAGGHPGAGAAVGAVNQALEIMGGANRRAIFAGGVFDLARRINRDLRAVPRMPELLRPLLTQQERERFGI